jgi:nitrogen regulatory protein P-II 1
MMRMVAIIRPDRLYEVQRRLEDAGATSFTISDVRGHGDQTLIHGTWRGERYVLHVTHKVQLEILCADEKVDSFAKTIMGAARTGQTGDGIIYTASVDQAWEIRSGLQGFRA